MHKIGRNQNIYSFSDFKIMFRQRSFYKSKRLGTYIAQYFLAHTTGLEQESWLPKKNNLSPTWPIV